MVHIKEIRAMRITTSEGSNLDDNDIKYIDVLYRALENVEQRFLVDNSPSANAGNEVIESSYTSRLVSKINILFEDCRNNPYDLDCVGPEKKGIYDVGKESHMIIKHPDIVIHKGEKPLEGIQEIVCEIKRLSMLGPEEMLYDLNKLLCYTRRETWGNPYRVGVFIVENATKNQFINKVKGYRKGSITIENLIIDKKEHIMTFTEFVQSNQKRLRNILCFCHSSEKVVELCSIYDIIQSKLNN